MEIEGRAHGTVETTKSGRLTLNRDGTEVAYGCIDLGDLVFLCFYDLNQKISEVKILQLGGSVIGAMLPEKIILRFEAQNF